MLVCSECLYAVNECECEEMHTAIRDEPLKTHIKGAWNETKSDPIQDIEDFVEEPDEVEKIIYDDTPEIIKERMREENTKIRIRNNRKSIRKTLRQ